ncbi:PhzF family phenazine biosynthesis protein [Rubellimicrobium aerolatum]|uniref:PhzF family phenazine biosynthesis protein n=1 Tax=Rubellimicrobium aerolatum TaxID=490979 RepID=A0ABW0SFH9_9RHOB|nr:PhzF family phenazine biosynthesis protein [Rubellimicrobium aerolatum]MBP1807159.1 PhzF family phenazine biosynthesis protein [Rubellimicrobium aerolatum]
MTHPIFLVDAFADRPFAGNPAGVMILDAALPEALMQAVAMEMNQAETAFVVPREGGWDIRWFTPTQEVAFCGHATLASAHVLATEHGAAGAIALHTREVGVLTVRTEGAGRYTLDVPRFDPEALDLSKVAPLVPGAVEAFRGGEDLFAVLPSEAAVWAFRPDLAAIAAHGARGLAVTAPGEGADFASRFFAPAAGIPEDPVTGSIHAALVPFWAARLGRDRLTAVQASRRGGRLEGRLAGDRVLLTGSAVTTLRGQLDLPD